LAAVHSSKSGESHNKENQMTFNLTKGATFSLSKEAPSLTRLRVALSWDRNPDTSKNTSTHEHAKDYDLDATAFITGTDKKVKRFTDFVWYLNESTRTARNGAVQLSEDERTGGKVGDDETIIVDLVKLPEDVTSIFFGVSIYEADERGQNFGQVPKAKLRLLDDLVYAPYFEAYCERNKEALALSVQPAEELDTSIGRINGYDLQEDFSTETAVLFAELYRHPTDKSDANGKAITEWKVRAIGRGLRGSLSGLIAEFGVPDPV
jgi:tellurium resistance protein TerD